MENDIGKEDLGPKISHTSALYYIATCAEESGHNKQECSGVPGSKKVSTVAASALPSLGISSPEPSCWSS